jgi:hypothetical protein
MTAFELKGLLRLMPSCHVYYCITGMHFGVTPYTLMRCHMGCSG